MTIFDKAPYVRFSILFHFRGGKISKIVPCGRNSTSIDFIEVEIADYGLQNFEKKNEKMKNLKKSIFFNFLSNLIVNSQKNQSFLNKKFIAVTRRAG